MQAYFAHVKKLMKTFYEVTVRKLPRSENQQVDASTKLASSTDHSDARSILWETLHHPSIQKKNVISIDRLDSWMGPIVEYLADGKLFEDEKEAESLK